MYIFSGCVQTDVNEKVPGKVDALQQVTGAIVKVSAIIQTVFSL